MAQIFGFSNSAPDAKVIINRGTAFETDITNDVMSFNCSNDVGGIFGNFTVVISNADDKHVDRYGKSDLVKMSSIEIYGKSNTYGDGGPSNYGAGKKSPADLNYTTITTSAPIKIINSTLRDSVGRPVISIDQTADIKSGVEETKGQSIDSIVEQHYDLLTSSPGDNVNELKDEYKSKIFAKNNGLYKFIDIRNVPLPDSQPLSESNSNTILAGGQKILLPPRKTTYKRVFLGVITNIADNIAPGSEMTITLSGQSFGYWLKASTINIHPGLNELGKGTFGPESLTPFSNKYAETKALDVFRDIIKFSTNDTLLVQDYSLGSSPTSYSAQSSGQGKDSKLVNELGESVSTPGNSNKAMTLANVLQIHQGKSGTHVTNSTPKNYTELNKSLYELEQDLLDGILLDGTSAQNLKSASDSNPADSNQKTKDNINSYDAKSKTITQLRKDFASETAKVNAQNASLVTQQSTLVKGSDGWNKIQDQIRKNSTKLSNREKQLSVASNSITSNSIVQSQNEIIRKLRDKFNRNLQKAQRQGNLQLLDNLGIIKHWQEIFSNIVLEVAGASFLQNVYPFKMGIQPPQILDGDYVSKADLGKRIADALMFEFYVDTNGHFVVKPPLYNIGVSKDDPTYIIEQEDLISASINDSVEGILTRVSATGDIRFPATLVREQTYNGHIDLNLINKYGLFNAELQSLIFLRTTQDCKEFCESYMVKNNLELSNASVTIMGRPDIRLGVACYFKPRDTVYYIKAISHDFQVGSGYTTTLNLIGARKIITGFKVNSTVKEVSKTNIGGFTLMESVTSEKQGIITHFLEANTRKSQGIIFNQKTGINGDVTGDVDGLDSKIGPIKNSYIITSHPSISYVGLIIDQNSIIISDININVFNFIVVAYTNGTNNLLKANYESIQSNFGKNTAPFDIIKTSFIDFCRTKGIFVLYDTSRGSTPYDQSEGNVKNFDRADLEEFIHTFLNSESEIISGLRSAGNLNDVAIHSSAVEYFNLMINDAGLFGAYKPYTDEDGRIYPSTLSFGYGLKFENAKLQFKKPSPAQQVKSSNASVDNLVSNIINQAKYRLNNPSS